MEQAELLTIDEVAAYLRIAPNTIYRWCRDGKLNGIKIGKEWRIARADLESFLTRRTGLLQVPPLAALLRTKLTPPEHILLMASDPDQVYRLQAEFCQVALRAGRPLFIGAWWQRPTEIRNRLTAAGLSVSELEASGKLTIGDFREAYTARGPRGVIEMWQQQAVSSGGQVFWGTGSHCLSDWSGRMHDLLRFETELHEAFKHLPVIALCPCVLDPVDKPSFEALVDLMPHHSGALFTPGGEPMLMRIVS